MAKEPENPNKDLLPTPPVGWPVVYFEPGDSKMEQPIAATVTAVEGPGRLKLAVQKPMKMIEHKVGVFHVTQPEILEGKWKNKATWHYLDGMTNAKCFDYHKAEVARLAKIREDGAVRQRELEENYQRIKAELKNQNEKDPVIPTAR
jgi:hypothetical protein